MNIVLIIFVVILIIVSLYYGIGYVLRKDVVLVSGVREGCCQLTFNRSSLPLPPINGGLEYTFSMWLYLAGYELKFDQPKIILYWKGKNIKDIDPDKFKQVEDGVVDKCVERELQKLRQRKKSCQLGRLGKYGGLKIQLAETRNDLEIIQTMLNGSKSKIVVPNIPMQKWLHIVVMLRLRNLDVFLNGVLYKNVVLPEVPFYGQHKLILNGQGGFDGFISQVRYFNRALSYPEIKSIWKYGYRH